MKKIILIIAVISVSLNSYAQELNKAEAKALKKEIKSLLKSPEEYKKLKESSDLKNVVINEQNSSIRQLQEVIKQKDLSIAKLNEKTQTLENQPTPSTNDCDLDNNGNKYRVQIGLYKNNDLTYLLQNPKFFLHENVDGVHRYSIGNFDTEAEAETFKIEMRRLGLSDAFVTEYKGGIREMNYSSSNPKVKNEPVKQKTGFNTSPPLKPVNNESNSKKIDIEELNEKIKNTNSKVQISGATTPSKPKAATTTNENEIKIDDEKLNDEIENKKTPPSSRIYINGAK